MLVSSNPSTVGAAGATSSEGTSEEMAVSEPQREGEEEERRREEEGEEENREGEEMESQSASIAVVEATGEELTAPMEESPSSGSSVQASLGDLVPPLPTPTTQEQPQQVSGASPVLSPGQSKCVYAVKICVQ